MFVFDYVYDVYVLVKHACTRLRATLGASVLQSWRAAATRCRSFILFSMYGPASVDFVCADTSRLIHMHGDVRVCVGACVREQLQPHARTQAQVHVHVHVHRQRGSRVHVHACACRRLRTGTCVYVWHRMCICHPASPCHNLCLAVLLRGSSQGR